VSTSRTLFTVEGAVAFLTFNRPEARNAMTAEMYDELCRICDRVDADDSIRAMVLDGAGGAFVAGADIGEFSSFTDGADGVAYEARQLRNIDRLASVRVPTLAAVQGFAVGGGMSIASVCDIRICTPDARFGYPTARTIGNCLAVQGYALLMSLIGEARTKDLVMRARLMRADEALAAGYVSEIVEPDQLASRAEEIVGRLLGHAPLSMFAAKESIRRIREANLPSTVDVIEKVYGSADFHEGVASFLDKRTPQWTGR
jgi:enoyl-CoA hydratase/carnithine racemase